ncbi:MAG: hypothetical protein IH986_03280 [Planctomycetes bacterium]|nr:hypothetical protein [Planctomycetota bacterium]
MPTRVRTPAIGLLSLALTGPLFAQTTRVVEFPPPAAFYQNTTFAIDGNTAYIPSRDNDVLWSFSLVSGDLLDPDGLVLPSPATASDPFLFPNDLLAVPGWFPSQGVFVADVSDPTDLRQVGVIRFPATTNIQGQNVEIDANGVVGYVAGFPNDTLYSFNITTLALEDPIGLALPGNPDRIALGGNRVAIVDTSNGRILVVDVSNPGNLSWVGAINLPGANTFGSNDNIVFAADGRTGFVSSNQRVLYSFDVQTMSVLDPDGIAFGTGSFGDYIAIHGNTIAAISSRGLSFIDVSDPSDMTLIANANFGGTVAPQGSATVAFTADGNQAAMPVIFPANLIYIFEVATGAQAAPPFPVGDQPNFLTIFGPADQVGVVYSRQDQSVWLIGGLFGHVLGDLNCDGAFNGGDIDPFFLALGDPPGYHAAFPACDIMLADMNGDGSVNGGDIDAFFACLAAGGCP